MLGAFLLPLGYLSLDHARIDSVAARVSPLPLHLPEQALLPRLKGCRRLAVTFRQAAFQDLETPGERQPVWIEVHRRGGLEHQRPDHKMAQRQRILLRQERSSQTGNHGTHGRTRKSRADPNSLFRVFRWIPWLISDSSGAAVGCCWTESAVRICADLGCRGNRSPGSPPLASRSTTVPAWLPAAGPGVSSARRRPVR